MDQVILRVLASEVQRRKCPGCSNSLQEADISARFAGRDKVELTFCCRFCLFEGGGEIELTSEIYREAVRAAGPVGEGSRSAHSEPISADEVLMVHEILAGWHTGVVELLASTSRPQT